MQPTTPVGQPGTQTHTHTQFVEKPTIDPDPKPLSMTDPDLKPSEAIDLHAQNHDLMTRIKLADQVPVQNNGMVTVVTLGKGGTPMRTFGDLVRRGVHHISKKGEG